VRLLLVMPTGLQVGYDDYFSASPLGIETLAAHTRAHADVELADMRGKGRDVEAHAEDLLKRAPDIRRTSGSSSAASRPPSSPRRCSARVISTPW
jgi:hypothetical protein